MEPILIVNVVLLWGLVLFNLLLTLALIRRVNAFFTAGPEREMETLKVGEPAPDFEAETLEGQTATLADYAGRSVVFLFSSEGCGSCRSKLPYYETLLPKARQAGTELVLVSVDTREIAEDMVKEFQVSLPVLIAPMGENPLQDDYKAEGMPFYCHVNEEGIVQATGYFDGVWDSLAQSWTSEASASQEGRS